MTQLIKESSNKVRVESHEVIKDRLGSLGHICLNRPKALNSLTLDMVRSIESALDEFLADRNVAAILLTGAGERGLCAGGDIRALYDSGRSDGALAKEFWREEYVLNERICRYPKAYIAIMDGITMGGGVGLSAHGSHRIVTERTRLAMPETGIGFFPDIGASWLLTRTSGEFGTFVALTGRELGAADAINAGLADYYVPSSDLAALCVELSMVSLAGAPDQVISIIERFKRRAPESDLMSHRALIDRTFGFDRIEEILEALALESDSFAEGVRAALLSKSPTSLKVTLRLLRLGRQTLQLRSCLEREFTATGAVLKSWDFYEGVRAAVIDKDRDPKWKPPSIESVSEKALAEFFVSSAPSLFPRAHRR